jgi:polygalacturonase
MSLYFKADEGAAVRRAASAVSAAAPVAPKRRRRPRAPKLTTNGSPAPFEMPAVRPPTFPARVVDVRDHGAVADGATDCTAAFAAAIAACAAAGGGRVLIPAGEWLTGPIHLRSDIDLHVADGATVRFHADPRRYLPPVFVRWSGLECYNYSPLIYARDCRNLAVTGRGTLLGGGPAWWAWEKAEARSAASLYQMVLAEAAVEQRCFGDEGAPLRPQFICPVNCTNVLLEDFTIGEAGPFWNVHVTYCRNVTVRGLRVHAPDGPNTDGIVIDSSRDVLIEDCELHTGEDCVGLKSGLNEDGWRVGRPTENVVIRRVRATGGYGGVAIGSDMSGGVRRVLVHDCHFDGTTVGIRLKAARGRGGVVEDVFVRDVTMGRVTGDAIQMTTEYSTFVSPDGKVPVFRNIHVRGVTCEHARTAARLIGLHDSPLRDVTLEDVRIASDEGLHCVAGSGVRLTNVAIAPRRGPVLSVRDSRDVIIHGLHGAAVPGSWDRGNGDGGGDIDGPRHVPAGVFLDLRGRRTQNIRLLGEATNPVRPAVVLGIDVPKDAVAHE